MFRSRDVLAAGLLTREALRSSAWRRLFRGVYADSSLSDGADLRIAGAALDELAAAAGALPTGRGSRRARRAVGLSDGRAESPPESRLRVLLTLAGIPPVPQYKVFDGSGRFLARVDFGYPEMKIAIEYDGVWHAEAGQFRRDRRRLNELVGAGWLVLHVTAADLRDPEALVERVRQLHKLREMREMGV